VAINDVSPLKAARRYAIANVKWLLGPRDTNDLTRSAAPPYSARTSAIYPLPFGKVWLGSVCCTTLGNAAERRIYGACSKTSVLF